jgi:hypothetical protein
MFIGKFGETVLWDDCQFCYITNYGEKKKSLWRPATSSGTKQIDRYLPWNVSSSNFFTGQISPKIEKKSFLRFSDDRREKKKE